MIRKAGRNISTIAYGSRIIAEIRLGTRLVYTAIRSCFGSGRWIPDKPWIGSEPWRR